MLAIIPAGSESKTTSKKDRYFRRTHVILPAAVLLLAIILAAFFYHLLPAEAAYHFTGGAPDRWMGRQAIIAWLVVPQLFLVLAGIAVSACAAALGARFQLGESTQVRKVLLIMGNMVALPQIILAFAMLDIFLYNAYRIHLMPIWVFALIVIVAGGMVLGIFFIQALRQSYKLPG